MKKKHNGKNISTFLSDIEYKINVGKCLVELLKEHYQYHDYIDFCSILLLDKIEQNNTEIYSMVEDMYVKLYL